ncbi:MAG: SufE family protein [Paludibacteraceae bacterium]|nr:SufE family protein [Paludibacteraceae bacterium]
MSIAETQDEIIEEFASFDDWMDRYSLLIEYGNGLEPLPEADKTDKNLIDGCQSKVWFTCELVQSDQPAQPVKLAQPAQPVVVYHGDSDAILVKGIVALLIRVLSGHTPQEIVDADLHFIDDIQLREHLSPTRTNGLNAMLRQMRLFALTYTQKK